MPKKDIIYLCMLCNNIGNLYNFAIGLLLKRHKKQGSYSNIGSFWQTVDNRDIEKSCFLTKKDDV